MRPALPADLSPVHSPPAYFLGLIAAVMCVHGIDRMGFSIVLDSVKHAMSLTDTQLGLLAGPAFALLNAGAAIPLARLADRHGRTRVLSACVMIWSLCTAISGLTTSFAGLAAARACVGFADSAASPVSQSLIAGRYKAAQLAGALSIFGAGSYLGTVLGFAVAGTVTQHFGWRAAMIWMGVPGLILAALVWLTLEERQEGAAPPATAEAGKRAWLGEWIPIVRQPVFLDATMTVASASILGWAVIAWMPSFFQRRYGMGPEEIGFWLAGAMGVGAAVGALAGGAAANLWYSRFPRAGLWLSFWATLASAPLLTMAFVLDNKAACLACVMASTVTGAICMGPVYAAVQGLADRRTRATVAAAFGVASTLLGQALGPLLVGVTSDFSARHYGGDSLRRSLEIVSLLGFWPAIHLYRLARRHTVPDGEPLTA